MHIYGVHLQVLAAQLIDRLENHRKVQLRFSPISSPVSNPILSPTPFNYVLTLTLLLGSMYI